MKDSGTMKNHFSFSMRNGIEYAYVRYFDQDDAASDTKPKSMYLGRVLDKDQCIFKNQADGVFQFDLESLSKKSAPNGFVDPTSSAKSKAAKASDAGAKAKSKATTKAKATKAKPKAAKGSKATTKAKAKKAGAAKAAAAKGSKAAANQVKKASLADVNASITFAKAIEAEVNEGNPSVLGQWNEELLYTAICCYLGDGLNKLKNLDLETIQALIMFYCVCDGVDTDIQSWYSQSGAHDLYPNAKLGEEEIEALLLELSWTDTYREDFMYEYLSSVAYKIASKNHPLTIESIVSYDEYDYDEDDDCEDQCITKADKQLLMILDSESKVPLFYTSAFGKNLDSQDVLSETTEVLYELDLSLNYVVREKSSLNELLNDIYVFGDARCLVHLDPSSEQYQKIFNEHAVDWLVSEDKKAASEDNAFASKYVYLTDDDGLDDDYSVAFICVDYEQRKQALRDQSQPSESRANHAGVYIMQSDTDVIADDILKMSCSSREILDQTFDLSMRKAAKLNLGDLNKTLLRGHYFIAFMANIVLYGIKAQSKKLDQNPILSRMNQMFSPDLLKLINKH